MKPGYLRALHLLHQTFRHYPFSMRLHILIRFFTCPFLRTLDLIPRGATILDIGAGHGTFGRLAIAAGAKKVFSVEPDIRKALLPLRSSDIRFVAGFDDAIRGTFDVVSIYDAIYRIPTEQRIPLFQRVFARLEPGGLFILKDLDASHRTKMGWARLQEMVSDSLLGVSIGEGFVYESGAQIRQKLEAIGFTDFYERKIDQGYPHSHIVYTARRPA